MSSTPIADHALLSDRHSSALVTRAGSVDWLSFPRFDSPSVFGRLLGKTPATGRCTERRVDEQPALRRRSLVLETTFKTPSGSWSSPTRWRWGRTTADTGSASVPRICSCAGWPAQRARSRWTSTTSRARSTA